MDYRNLQTTMSGDRPKNSAPAEGEAARDTVADEPLVQPEHSSGESLMLRAQKEVLRFISHCAIGYANLFRKVFFSRDERFTDHERDRFADRIIQNMLTANYTLLSNLCAPSEVEAHRQEIIQSAAEVFSALVRDHTTKNAENAREEVIA